MIGLPWPAVGSVAAGLGSLWLVQYLRAYRDKPGASWFIATLCCQALWCLSYGVSLFVFDPQLRWAFEVVTWTAMSWTGVCFLAFGLDYTGRGSVVRTWWFRALLVVPAATTVLVATTPFHGFIWTDFRIDPVFGAATVLYDMGPWAFVGVGLGTVFATVGTLLLFDTVLRYGPLYRQEAIAVGLSVIPPGTALTVWLFQIGPYPALNLTPLMFIPHVALDAYAFVGSDMFEFNPATRRTGEQAAINDVGSPVVVVNEAGRIVNLNDSASETFDRCKEEVLTEPLSAIYEGDSVDLTDTEQVVSIRAGDRWREFAVTTTELTDSVGTHVGYTVAFQDVTEQQLRKQRVTVLNRVLRHSVRNQAVVITGHAEMLDTELEDEFDTHLSAIQTAADRLVASGEKARAFSKSIRHDEPQRGIDLASLVGDVLADLRAKYPNARLDSTVPAGVTLETSPQLLSVVVENVVENGIEHDEVDPHVTVSARTDAESVTLTIRDDGPGIPEQERTVIETETESPLDHGSGIGLWVVRWGVTTLGGELDLSVEDGTTVRLTFPTVGTGPVAQPALD